MYIKYYLSEPIYFVDKKDIHASPLRRGFIFPKRMKRPWISTLKSPVELYMQNIDLHFGKSLS